jgi:hypothetical protein
VGQTEQLQFLFAAFVKNEAICCNNEEIETVTIHSYGQTDTQANKQE